MPGRLKSFAIEPYEYINGILPKRIRNMIWSFKHECDLYNITKDITCKNYQKYNKIW